MTTEAIKVATDGDPWPGVRWYRRHDGLYWVSCRSCGEATVVPDPCEIEHECGAPEVGDVE